MSRREAVFPVPVTRVEPARQQDLIPTEEKQMNSGWKFSAHEPDYTRQNRPASGVPAAPWELPGSRPFACDLKSNVGVQNSPTLCVTETVTYDT